MLKQRGGLHPGDIFLGSVAGKQAKAQTECLQVGSHGKPPWAHSPLNH